MKNNRWLIVLGAVVVVAGLVAFASWTGLYPPKSGTEGAIGAANRYQARQISADDVKVTESQMQAFLQSDLFHKIATNPSFRNVVQSEAFMDLAKRSKNRQRDLDVEALRSPKIVKFFINEEFIETLKKSREYKNFEDLTKRVLRQKAGRELASDDRFFEMLKDPRVHQLVEQAEQLAGRTHELRESSLWVETLKTHSQMLKGPKADAFFEFVTSEEMSNIGQAELADWAKILEETQIEQLFNDEGFLELIDSGEEMLNLATSEEMAEEFSVLVEFAKHRDLLAALEDPTVMEALNSLEIQELAKQDKLTRAVADID